MTEPTPPQSEDIYIVAELDDNYPYGLYFYCAHLSKEAADRHVNLLKVHHTDVQQKDKNLMPEFIIFKIPLLRDPEVFNFLKENQK